MDCSRRKPSTRHIPGNQTKHQAPTIQTYYTPSTRTKHQALKPSTRHQKPSTRHQNQAPGIKPKHLASKPGTRASIRDTPQPHARRFPRQAPGRDAVGAAPRAQRHRRPLLQVGAWLGVDQIYPTPARARISHDFSQLIRALAGMG